MNYKSIGEINRKLFNSGKNREKSFSYIRHKYVGASEDTTTYISDNNKSIKSHRLKVKHKPKRVSHWKYQYTDLKSYFKLINSP